jgi:single-stranded DNA-binding protein
MNTITFQKKVTQLESFIRKASRVLLEFEIAQSEWEIAHGKYKVFKSADSVMRHVRGKLKA